LKLFSQNSNLYDHDTSASQTDRRTDGQLALALPRSARLRAEKKLKKKQSVAHKIIANCVFRFTYIYCCTISNHAAP